MMYSEAQLVIDDTKDQSSLAKVSPFQAQSAQLECSVPDSIQLFG